MTTSLTARPSTSIFGPVEHDVGLAADVAPYWDSITLQSGQRALRVALPDELRSRIGRRIEALNKALEPARPSDVASTIARLLAGFGAARATGDEAKVVVAQYVAELKDLPLWTIEAGCHALARGQVAGQSLDFPPSTARVRQSCEEFAHKVRSERLELSAALQAKSSPPLIDPNMRRQIGAGMRALGESLSVFEAQQTPRRDEDKPLGDDDLRALYPAPGQQPDAA